MSVLWLGAILGALCAFFAQIQLARELSPEVFGIFASTLAMVVLISPLAGFGIGGFWLKVFGQEGWQALRWIRPSIRFAILSTSLSLVSLYIWAYFGPHDVIVRNLIFIFSIHILGQLALELVSAKLQLEERYLVLAMWQFIPHFFRLSLILLLAFIFNQWFQLYSLAWIFALVATVILIIGFFSLLQMQNGTFLLKGHVKQNNYLETKLTSYQLFLQTWPFGLAGVFHLIYFQSDLILIKYLVSDEAAGFYNIAFLIMTAVYLMPAVIYQKFLLPKIHRWANHNREQFHEVFRKGNWVMFLLGISATLLIWIFAPLLIQVLFGASYSPAINALNILAIAAPVRFVASSVGSVLTTQKHMQSKVGYMGITAAVNIALNFLLIPYYSIIGAAISTVISELFLLLLYIKGSRLVFSTAGNENVIQRDS